MVHVDEPQGHRHALPPVRLHGRHRRRRPVDRHAAGTAAAGPAILLEPAGLQRLRDRPRPHHGVLHGDAHPDRRVRQLVRAPDDRSARHGVSADEQHLVLAARGGLGAAALLAVRRGRSRLARLRRRLDGLSAALGHRPSRPGARFRHPGAAPRGCVLDPRRHQLHHHHPQHARSRHDAAQDAALRLVDAGDGVPAAPVAPGSRRRDHHAADGPQLRHHLLRSVGRRRSDPLPAPVLVLRSPRSVHHDPAGLRHRQPHHLDLLQEADLRLSRHGLRHGGDRRRRLRRVGSPHVHGRPVAPDPGAISSSPPW